MTTAVEPETATAAVPQGAEVAREIVGYLFRFVHRVDYPPRCWTWGWG